MNFRSDNTASAAPEMLAAIAAANEAQAPPYGDDPWSRKLERVFAEVFEHEVRVFTVATGTAANAIALASAAPPWGAIFCHREAHIERDECGAPEFYSGGAKLMLTEGAAAKMSPAALIAALKRPNDVHTSAPAALSLSQATERGAIYTPEEVGALGAVARAHGMSVHMDGARLANAIAALGCAPADITWRAGVDLLSFGATKNGALGAEAIVAFDPAFAEQIERRRKRGGQLMCKGRYAAAQLLAYVEERRWLSWAGRANDLAARVGEAAGSLLSTPVETNQVFMQLGSMRLAALRQAGVEFLDWGDADSGEARFVVSWNQSEAEVESLVRLVRELHE